MELGPTSTVTVHLCAFLQELQWKKVTTQSDMAPTQAGGDGLPVVVSGLLWDRVPLCRHMVRAFEKKGRVAMGLLFLCSKPEVMPEGRAK